MPIYLYNSLTATKELFEPLVHNHVGLYVCGPTVYGDSHLGHAKTYVSFDVIVRYLRYCGYTVTYVQNVTDVGHLTGDTDDGEDKILKKAKEINQQPMAIAEYYTRHHYAMMAQMNLLPPDICPRATGHIPEQLETVEQLLQKGSAYQCNGSVYFQVAQDSEYGILSKRKGTDMLSGTRIESRAEKKDPRDFALWKQATPEHLMRWKDSFQGWGYPGWHTECVSMSMRYLGEQFDIHGGGMDLKFPHHECELAQARALGKPYARYWLHSNLLTVNGQKMAKSLDNSINLVNVFAEYHPLILRYFIVTSHYRSVVDYNQQSLQSAQISLNRLHETVHRLRQRLPHAERTPSGKWFVKYQQRFYAAMDDDFSTPQAVAVLFDLMKESNRLLQEDQPNLEAVIDAEYLLSTLGGDILGIIPMELETKRIARDQRLEKVMEIMVELRRQFRQQKDYARSDYIREQLKQANITLKDVNNGTTWE